MYFFCLCYLNLQMYKLVFVTSEFNSFVTLGNACWLLQEVTITEKLKLLISRACSHVEKEKTVNKITTKD